MDWAKAWIATLTELQDYVKQHHTTGVSWNPKVSTPVSVPLTYIDLYPKVSTPVSVPLTYIDLYPKVSTPLSVPLTYIQI